ncbi:MAG: GFA family protein [Geitlerinemataceae cyanobacterium]
MTDRKTYEGGCHCGAVRFRVIVGKHQALDCNCSICTKKGFVHLIVPPEQFELLQGAEALSTYTFNTGIARHTFCSICGIHPFYHPRSHPDDYDVNVRCLDGNLLSQFRIVPFNGANWEDNIDRLRSSQEQNR